MTTGVHYKIQFGPTTHGILDGGATDAIGRVEMTDTVGIEEVTDIIHAQLHAMGVPEAPGEAPPPPVNGGETGATGATGAARSPAEQHKARLAELKQNEVERHKAADTRLDEAKKREAERHKNADAKLTGTKPTTGATGATGAAHA